MNNSVCSETNIWDKQFLGKLFLMNGFLRLSFSFGFFRRHNTNRSITTLNRLRYDNNMTVPKMNWLEAFSLSIYIHPRIHRKSYSFFFSFLFVCFADAWKSYFVFAFVYIQIHVYFIDWWLDVHSTWLFYTEKMWDYFVLMVNQMNFWQIE